VYFLPFTVVAQEFRATLNGSVTDSAGAFVPGAIVQIRNAETGEVNTAETSQDGNFSVPFLRPGTYVVTAEAAGFKKAIRENIALLQGQKLSVTLTMETGAVTETVTVTSERQLLETENADRGTVIDNRRVTEFPLSGRNPLMLSTLVPGVSFRGGSARAFDNGSINRWTINGSPIASTEYQLDGAPNNTQAGNNNVGLIPSVDAVSEFRISTNSYDAQYGKTGGGIISISTKSGTNDFHGSVYDFWRRGGLSANTFQNNRNGSPRGLFKMDQYGFQVGGPVWLPKVYDGHNRTFFMVAWEKYKDDDPRALTLSVPEPEFLNGDFSKLRDANGNLITIFDPATGRLVGNNWVRDPFPGNIIPAKQINPTAQKILGFVVKPNRPSGPGTGSTYSQNNFFNPAGVNNWGNEFYNFVMRFDHNFNSKHKMYFRYAKNDRAEIKNTNGNITTFGQTETHTTRVNDAYALDWVSTLSPKAVFNVRISYSDFFETASDDGNLGFDLTSLGFPSSLVSQLPVQDYFGRYGFTDYLPPGQATSLGFDARRNTTYNYAIHPNITWIHSLHNIKTGVDLRRVRFINRDVGNAFRFDSNRVFTQRDPTVANQLQGNSIASFLLGAPSSGNVEFRANPDTTVDYAAPYIQDDWKMTPRLTINLGLRYDFNTPPRERDNNINRGFAFGTLNPVEPLVNHTVNSTSGTPTTLTLSQLNGGLLFAGVDGVPERTANIFKKGIQPRVGVAYQLRDNIVLRGGWGRYFMNPSNAFIQTAGFTFVNNAVTSLDSNRTPATNSLINPYPNGLTRPAGSNLGLRTFLGQNLTIVNPNYRLPHIDHFAVGVQMRLPFNSILDVSYVGSRGNDIESSKQINEIPLALRQQCNRDEGGDPNVCNQAFTNPFRNIAGFEGTNRFSATTLARSELARPFPQFGSINEVARNDGKTWYDSLQVTLETRRRGGVNLISTYTFSKSVALDGFLDVQQGIMQKGLTESDRPHRFTLGVVSDLPFGTGKRFFDTNHWLLGRLVSGWQLNAIFQAQSGLPWSLRSGVNYAYVKDARLPNVDRNAEVVRAIRPCVVRLENNGTRTLVTSTALAAEFGCSLTDFNFLILPSFAPTGTPLFDTRLRNTSRPNLDLSMAKTTRVSERTSLQLRFEVFNVVNAAIRPNFNNDPSNVNFGVALKRDSNNASSGAGALGAQRTVQLGVKFIF